MALDYTAAGRSADKYPKYMNFFFRQQSQLPLFSAKVFYFFSGTIVWIYIFLVYQGQIEVEPGAASAVIVVEKCR